MKEPRARGQVQSPPRQPAQPASSDEGWGDWPSLEDETAAPAPMWMVHMDGTWQPADDAVVRQWIRQLAVGPDTMIRHSSWAQPRRLAEVPVFQQFAHSVGVAAPASLHPGAAAQGQPAMSPQPEARGGAVRPSVQQPAPPAGRPVPGKASPSNRIAIALGAAAIVLLVALVSALVWRKDARQKEAHKRLVDNCAARHRGLVQTKLEGQFEPAQAVKLLSELDATMAAGQQACLDARQTDRAQDFAIMRAKIDSQLKPAIKKLKASSCPKGAMLRDPKTGQHIECDGPFPIDMSWAQTLMYFSLARFDFRKEGATQVNTSHERPGCRLAGVTGDLWQYHDFQRRGDSGAAYCVTLNATDGDWRKMTVHLTGIDESAIPRLRSMKHKIIRSLPFMERELGRKLGNSNFRIGTINVRGRAVRLSVNWYREDIADVNGTSPGGAIAVDVGECLDEDLYRYEPTCAASQNVRLQSDPVRIDVRDP